MSQNPPAGTAVSPGSAVSITIGQSPPNGCP
jgi:beta-lactam-binding protein with PASTA domain